MDYQHLLRVIEEKNKLIEERINELNEINSRLRQKQDEVKRSYATSKDKFNAYLHRKQANNL
jgi:hypothetical protein